MKIRPPQFVFDIAAAKAAHDFMEQDALAKDIVEAMVGALEPLFDTSELAEDVLEAIRRYLLFISSRQITNLPWFLMSFVWYRSNYENPIVRRTKTPLFEDGRVRAAPSPGLGETSRVLNAAKALRAYADAVHKNLLPARPKEWTPTDEVAFSPLMDILFVQEWAADPVAALTDVARSMRNEVAEASYPAPDFAARRTGT